MESIRELLNQFPNTNEIDLLCIWPLQQIVIAFQKVEDKDKETVYTDFWNIVTECRFHKKSFKKMLLTLSLEDHLKTMLTLFYKNSCLLNQYPSRVISSLYLYLSFYLYCSYPNEKNFCLLQEAKLLYWEIAKVIPII